MAEDVQSRSFNEVSAAAAAAVNEATQGAAMQQLTVRRKSAYIDLKHSGQLKPATVINFNPIPLAVHDGHVRWRIPAATDDAKKGVKIAYGNLTYEAAYFTVREPAFVPWITDVKKPAPEDENARGVYDAKFILPIELLDQYKREYTDPSRNMTGGVMVIEGDIHSLTKNKGTILIPKMVRKPDRSFSYFTEEADYKSELAACLDMQKSRCEFMIRQGDEYNQTEQERKNITPVHRAWYGFALKMGWKAKECAWMSSTLEPEDTCKGCGKGIPPGAAWFCECGRPYNPFAAFMAGEPVPESYLFALTEKELGQVKVEMERRAKIRATFEPKA